ncbi:hypothetical protein BJF92_18680 [Rhizobium rhizosphaerae]|uniref:diguanylate cyclase n=1 Tax=Xaviernesmea rhizosphaerae TaxID=1672749 RepID=A0A1Q9ADR6_9HYPH|nr:GGDEF domain-containing protein [Xaviernesmea rhizosphaerae]OLP53058.1 hypothetical protein BJF92_18680 [Xaviernesmea rhizosphaerae]
MDISTVLLLQKTSYIAGAIVLLFMRRTLPNTDGVVAIAACFALLSIGSTIAAGLDPQAWNYAILAWTTLLMGVAAYALWAMGLTHLSGQSRRISLWHVFGVTLAVMAPATLAGLHAVDSVRGALFMGMACASLIFSAIVVWRDNAVEPLRVRPLLAGVTGASGLLCGVAAVEFLTNEFWLISPASIFFLLIVTKFLFTYLVTVLISERQHIKLQRLADTDGLTGVANRRAFERSVGPQLKADDVILLIDVDRFKSINDRFGHAGGDDVLKSIAETLRHLTPRNGLVARYGGEEFCVHLPVEAGDAAQIAERMRAAIERRQLESEMGEIVHVTVSIGLARVRESEDDLRSACSRADKALYHAKNAGRNRVLSFDDGRTITRMRSAR